MSLQAPIADMLCMINNACAVRKAKIELPSSKLKMGIAKVLLQEGYIEKFISNGRILELHLKYYNDLPVIAKIKMVSRPSLRKYCGVKELMQLRVKGGLGIAILSTPNGVISNHKARKLNCGGEVLCYVE